MAEVREKPIASTSPLHFARFEFKYILSSAKRKAVEKDLLYFLDYDPFVAQLPDHRYFVRSLYFDDPSYSAFHDKIDGLKSRYKFRVRTYAQTFTDSAPIFLEIKGRHNNLVYKHRTPVQPGASWNTLAGNLVSNELLSKASESQVRDQFEYDLYRKSLQPIALIDYQRRPYISKYDPSFRITFDEQLRAIKAMGLFPGAASAPRRVLAGCTVVEVKFRHHLPAWFHQVIQAHELRRVSISKIVSGMEVLDMAYDEH
ncbi:MAG: polyphosphate polymerase domain-containing protein [Proteobacteria bacterium]|jgi:hypothetical protein|nr:polyphosphate polymerase domain-containing protein [Pseudomonadota bacterium]